MGANCAFRRASRSFVAGSRCGTGVLAVSEEGDEEEEGAVSETSIVCSSWVYLMTVTVETTAASRKMPAIHCRVVIGELHSLSVLCAVKLKEACCR